MASKASRAAWPPRKGHVPDSQHVARSITKKPCDFAHWFLLPVVLILCVDFFFHISLGFGLDRAIVHLVADLTRGNR